jgi:hypothetical protein
MVQGRLEYRKWIDARVNVVQAVDEYLARLSALIDEPVATSQAFPHGADVEGRYAIAGTPEYSISWKPATYADPAASTIVLNGPRPRERAEQIDDHCLQSSTEMTIGSVSYIPGGLTVRGLLQSLACMAAQRYP